MIYLYTILTLLFGVLCFFLGTFLGFKRGIQDGATEAILLMNGGYRFQGEAKDDLSDTKGSC